MSACHIAVMAIKTYTDNIPLDYQELEPPNVGSMLLFLVIGFLYIAVTSPFWVPFALWRKIRKIFHTLKEST